MNAEALAFAAKINKAHGDGTIAVASAMTNYGRITSGSLSIDVALGGGWPTGQWHEVIGKESQGKTVVVLKTIAANQQANPDFTTLWVASEHYDEDQATSLGVDNDRVQLVPSNDMEFAYETLLEGCASRAFDAVVLDSYPALISRAEDEKTMDDVQVAPGARVTGKFFRKVGPAMRRSLDAPDRPVTGFFINQYRDKIGGFSPAGIPQTSPGGNGKNYFFYTRVEVRRDEFIDEARSGKGKTRVGQVIKVKTLKNKSAPPQQIATVDFYFRDAPLLGFNRGDYDLAKEFVTYGILFDIIRRGGAYYSYGERKWGPGQDKLLDAVRAEIDLQEELREKILFESKRPDRERLGARE